MTRHRIPLFPLPEVVLLPGALLPLHIFEPRYKAMIADALEGDRTIGMAMLKPGWEAAGDSPAIYPIGGAGEIIESEELEDGRYNILLQGKFRYRVLEESPADPYRTARVEEIASVPFGDRTAESRARRRALALFDEVSGALSLPPLPEERLGAERLASEIALRLRYAPPELQAILELDSLPARYESLTGRMLEWRRRIRFLEPFRPPELDPSRN
jgi:hypothetical protein